jgi:hypothetical protein
MVDEIIYVLVTANEKKREIKISLQVKGPKI